MSKQIVFLNDLIEGDWPDCCDINRHIKGYPGSKARAEDVLQTLERWPTWMWAN